MCSPCCVGWFTSDRTLKLGIGQGQTDQLLQLRVDKKLLPGYVGHHLVGRFPRSILVAGPVGQVAETDASGRL